MANPEHVEIVRRGRGAIAEWWKRPSPTKVLDLREADFSKADLSERFLAQAEFDGANLKGADLGWSVLVGARFHAADLSSSHLGAANLRLANLHDAKLRGAHLMETVFVQTNMRGADLSGAVLLHTVFSDVDLSEVSGLENVIHYAPSFVSIETLVRSRGNIPEAFLRGCGIPEAFIANLHSLIGAIEPIQFYSCFLCHSKKDLSFVQRLYDRMRMEGMKVWKDDEELLGGKKLHLQIEDAIRLYDKLLVVLSESSINSDWVEREIRKGWEKEKERGKQTVLFPIRLCPYDALLDWGPINDSKTGKNLCDEIRDYFIPDFSRWEDDDAFEREFQRLLSALKAEGGKGAEGLAR